MAIKQVCFSVDNLIKFLHSAEAATLTGIIYMVQLTHQYYRLLYITVNHVCHIWNVCVTLEVTLLELRVPICHWMFEINLTCRNSHGECLRFWCQKFVAAWTFCELYGKSSFELKGRSYCAYIFQKIRSHLKILGFRRVILSRCHTEDPQMLGATLQNWNMVVTWHPGLVHPWSIC